METDEEKVANELKNLAPLKNHWKIFLVNLERLGIEDIEFHDSIHASEYFSDETCLNHLMYGFNGYVNSVLDIIELSKGLLNSIQDMRINEVKKAVKEKKESQKIVFIRRQTPRFQFNKSNTLNLHSLLHVFERYSVGLVDKDATMLGR